jgi:Tfp pilus assembly PilM family ATPase
MNWEVGFEQTKDQKYWDDVRSFIKEFVEKSEIGKVDVVVLTGESANDGRFKEAVKNALGKDLVSSKSVLKNLGKESEKDPLYVIALGAAEMAKRKQEGMGRCIRDKESCKPKGKDEL